MAATPKSSIRLNAPAETMELARRIAPKLRAGDVILLEGPIGAGKTYFARAVIQSLLEDAGLAEDVPSPTFTLVQTYDAGSVEIWHADLYRLSGPAEVYELGLDEAFQNAICLVEWPDRLGSEAPKEATRLVFSLGEAEEERVLEVRGDQTRWHALIAEEANV